MKIALLAFIAGIALAVLGTGLGGCVAEGGYVDTGVYYGPAPGPWFHDDIWIFGDPGWRWREHEEHERHERWEHVHPRRW